MSVRLKITDIYGVHHTDPLETAVGITMKVTGINLSTGQMMVDVVLPNGEPADFRFGLGSELEIIE